MPMRQLPLWIAALWWGSLTTLAFFVVPLLFAYLPTPAVAGNMAAKLFAVQTWLSTGCGIVLLLMFRSTKPLVAVNTAQAATLFVVAGVLMAMLVEFAVAPRIVARDNLAVWHGIGTAMFAVQWICAAVTLAKLAAKSD